MNEMSNIQLLLDKIRIIDFAISKRNATENFNIFKILRSETDEVNLHSRFIFELLNPNGIHGKGNIFLKIFSKICKFPSLSYDNVKVFREHKNIDILIQDNTNAIIIENKIHAGDQHNQLQRYYAHFDNSHLKPHAFYLTLHGHEPTEWSIGNLKAEVQIISYASQVNEWLEACIKESAINPILRETIIQYQFLVNHLTGNTMSNKEKHEIVALMAEGDNAKQGQIIVRNWVHVRWHTEWDFWNELLAHISKSSFIISEEGRFSEESLTRAIHYTRNKNHHYGIGFIVGKYNDKDVNIRIERNDGTLYYGIISFTDDEDVNNHLFTYLMDETLAKDIGWMAWKYPQNKIDFYSFNNSTTLDLVNKDKRKIIIEDIWNEIHSFALNISQYLHTNSQRIS